MVCTDQTTGIKFVFQSGSISVRPYLNRMPVLTEVCITLI